MLITPLPDSIEDLVLEAGPERTPGLHFSQIRESILQEITPKRRSKRVARSGQAEPASEQRGEGESDERGPLFWLYVTAGFLFERLLEQCFAAWNLNIFRPGEIEKDGILMSPDAINVEDWVLEEFKFTWKSSNGAPEDPKFWGWIIQMKAYCFALGINRARLRAFFVNGDYKSKQPEYRVWEFTFTDDELQENWNMLVSHARQKGWL